MKNWYVICYVFFVSATRGPTSHCIEVTLKLGKGTEQDFCDMLADSQSITWVTAVNHFVFAHHTLLF